MNRHVVEIGNVGNEFREAPEENGRQEGFAAEKVAAGLPPEIAEKHETLLGHLASARDSLLEMGAAEDVRLLDEISSNLKKR